MMAHSVMLRETANLSIIFSRFSFIKRNKIRAVAGKSYKSILESSRRVTKEITDAVSLGMEMLGRKKAQYKINASTSAEMGYSFLTVYLC